MHHVVKGSSSRVVRPSRGAQDVIEGAILTATWWRGPPPCWDGGRGTPERGAIHTRLVLPCLRQPRPRVLRHLHRVHTLRRILCDGTVIVHLRRCAAAHSGGGRPSWHRPTGSAAGGAGTHKRTVCTAAACRASAALPVCGGWRGPRRGSRGCAHRGWRAWRAPCRAATPMLRRAVAPPVPTGTPAAVTSVVTLRRRLAGGWVQHQRLPPTGTCMQPQRDGEGGCSTGG